MTKHGQTIQAGQSYSSAPCEINLYITSTCLMLAESLYMVMF